MKSNSAYLILFLVISSLTKITWLVHGHRDGGDHFIRGNRQNGQRMDQTLASQFAIKPWSSEFDTNYDLADVVLTPSRENVLRTQVRDGSSTSSLNEDELVFASIYPFETETFITFDLSKADFFKDYALSNKKDLRDAKLQLFSLDRLPSDTSFDIVLLDEGSRKNDIEMLWRVDSSSVDRSSCASSKNCWIDLDVTDGLLWSVEQQKNMKEWQGTFTLTVRISLPRRQSQVSGSFASSKYDGQSYAPRLTLDFFNQGNNDINYYSSSIEPQNKPGRKHIVKGVKGPRKKTQNPSKTNDNISAFTAVGARPDQDSKYNGIQYNTYIIVDTENLPLTGKNQPGRKYIVKGVKGPRKKPKENYSVQITRRPTKRPSGRPTRKPSRRPTKRPSNNILAPNDTNSVVSFQPNKVNSKPGDNNSFTSIKPIAPMSGTGSAGKVQSGGTNASGGSLSGPNGPNVGYNQGDGPSVTYSQNSQPGTGNAGTVQSSGSNANGGWANGPNGPNVGYNQGNGPSVTYNTGSAPNEAGVSYTGSGGAKESFLWYMNYQIGRCVMDCANGAECGGQANFWDILFESQENCCRQMNYWNSACITPLT
eukprot:CCRYP_008156-RA/>CCRYP_008156-RA protein AED:0.27 eAED:0.27 QI:0/-1/0/1/-1/1/1/0/592